MSSWSAAKDLVRRQAATEILRCDQDDSCSSAGMTGVRRPCERLRRIVATACCALRPASSHLVLFLHAARMRSGGRWRGMPVAVQTATFAYSAVSPPNLERSRSWGC